MRDKKKLKILLASSYAFTKEPGGVKDFILGLKKALNRLGCATYIIAPESEDFQERELVDSVLGMSFKITTDQTEFRASLSRKETAKKILRTIKPDIIVIHEPFLPSLGHTIISSLTKEDKRSKPIIIGQFHARREDLNWPLKVVKFIVKHFARRPNLNKKTILGLSSGYVSTINDNLDGRIAVSKATQKFWQKMLPADYKVIYNGIDTEKLTPNGPKIESWTKDNKKIIIFAGRHDPRKGISDLIDAVKILIQGGKEDIKLKIAGKGMMTKVLQKQVAKLKLQNVVEFIGILPYVKLAEAYRTADLVVAPSTGGEGFNRTIIEARSSGTLVVCTDIDGQNEAIGKDLSTFMAKPKNPDSLAGQIIKVLNLPEEEKQEIRQRGIRDVKLQYNWDKIAREHLEYYEKLIKNSII
jgi:glycosyltransferase involved in cell wall biosynthesis